jgi:hypothetical protein
MNLMTDDGVGDCVRVRLPLQAPGRIKSRFDPKNLFCINPNITPTRVPCAPRGNESTSWALLLTACAPGLLTIPSFF